MAANEPRHLIGENVDTVDQLSSLILLAMALAGACAVVGIHALIG